VAVRREREPDRAAEWTPVYRLSLDDAKARYYQHAFEVLGEFANAKSFPGGYTRSTMKKLQATTVPAYDCCALRASKMRYCIFSDTIR
jgi:hypothetical protein